VDVSSIDIGTSSVKAVIVDDKDTVVEAGLGAAQCFPSASRLVQQSPADWWEAQPKAAVKALPGAESQAVKAVGVSPARLHWRPRCSTPTTSRCARHSCGTTAAREAQCATLEKAEPRSRQITGNIAMPGIHRAQAGVGARETNRRSFKADDVAYCCPRTTSRLS
jgi:xylulokinase